MTQEIATTPNFQLPNRDALAKNSGGVFRIGLICVAGIAAWFYLLPFLLAIAVGTVEFFVTAAVGLFLLMVFTQKKFWRALNYYSQWIAEKLLSVAVELNPWTILNNAVDEQEKAMQLNYKNTNNLRGQQASLTDQVAKENQTMREAAAELKVLDAKRGKPGFDPDQFALDYQTAQTDFENAKGFIDEVQPLLSGIDQIVKFGDKAYQRASVMIKNMRSTIDIQKRKYEAVTAGSAAMNAAMKSMTGDSGANKDAQQALDFLRKDIGNKIGMIQGSMQVTAGFINQNDLKDAAKIQLAIDTAKKFDQNPNFNYSDTVTKSANGISGNVEISRGNKYVDNTFGL